MRTPPVWPHHPLAYESTVAQAQALAVELGELLGPGPYAWLEPGRFELVEKTMAHRHGLLEPEGADRFLILVDPQKPLPFFEAATVEARRRVIASHEIAHSFFFSRCEGAKPRRRFRPDECWEERFCNAFAAQVSGCPERDGLGGRRCGRALRQR